MTSLPINIALPSMRNDMTIAKAQMAVSGTMPPCKGLGQDIITEVQLCYIDFLITNQRSTEAEKILDDLVHDEDAMQDMPLMYAAWLWLAYMALLIDENEPSLALGAAEQALTELVNHQGKKTEDFHAIVAVLLYYLASAHHIMGDNGRAAKELTKSQQLLERLTKRNEARFSAMLLIAVESSTEVITSKVKQMNVLAYYQSASELYASELNSGDANATRTAMTNLVDTLGKQGDIMLEMGNGRNAVKYFTKALRYQKKLGEKMGERDLKLSIGLAKALMKLINRRAAAEQLLQSLLPLAHRLDAGNEVREIENLLNNRNKNTNIMTLLKSIFTAALILVGTLGMQAQLIIGHRGSQWGVENTSEALINGAKAGAWGLECDIRGTADGTFVLSHDSKLKRLAGPDSLVCKISTRDILDIPLSQTRHGVTYTGHIATLGEYLDICNEYNVAPVIEIKKDAYFHSESETEDPCYDFIPALIKMLDMKGCSDRAVIISFLPGVIDFIHRHYPDITVQVLAGDPPIEDWVNWCTRHHIDLDVEYSLLTQEAVDQLHAAGLKVNVWTVDNVEKFENCKAMGVDFITTNARFPHDPE